MLRGTPGCPRINPALEGEHHLMDGRRRRSPRPSYRSSQGQATCRLSAVCRIRAIGLLSPPLALLQAKSRKAIAKFVCRLDPTDWHELCFFQYETAAAASRHSYHYSRDRKKGMKSNVGQIDFYTKGRIGTSASPPARKIRSAPS
ncbi:hypothetical protein NKH10_31950 [Mesorhizobium sp. M1340]|uniref:hypothetical protein n=1 Tax=Mesorhizobium sp. M1340 TaxID=2957087 RepID=UPI00333B634D